MGMSTSPGVFPVLISGPFYLLVSLSVLYLFGLPAYCVEGNGYRSSRQIFGGLASIVNDGLVVLSALAS